MRKRDLIKAFARHPFRFTHAFIVGTRYARSYERATGKKFSDA